MASHSEKTNKRCALIIEDDMTWEAAWEKILKSIDDNIDVQWATSFKEASRLIEEKISQNQMFDIIVSDIFISGSQTGIDLMEKYLHQMKDQLLLVSGVDSDRLKELLGPLVSSIPFLRKPFSTLECFGAVERILQNSPKNLEPA